MVAQLLSMYLKLNESHLVSSWQYAPPNKHN